MGRSLERLAFFANRAIVRIRRNQKVSTHSGETIFPLSIVTPILLSLMLLCGCASTIGEGLKKPVNIIETEKNKPSIKERAELPAGGFKVGLIADSHFQTMKSLDFLSGLKGRTEDLFVATSLRAAGHKYLSPLVTAYLIDRLIKKEEVNAILYLGDGPENGCSDEIVRIFELLIEKRKESGIPIFYIIGIQLVDTHRAHADRLATDDDQHQRPERQHVMMDD